jgi:poly(3-hydroxybutyrate) depolymerase
MINSGGQNRQYYLKTPANYDNETPYRLIFMFHWFYGSINAIVNPPDADHNTDDPFYGLEEMAGDSTIFVVPQGLVDGGAGAGWQNPNDRDVNFTDDMLDQVAGDLCVDESRVFTTGFSYGGAISYKLACARQEKFRGAVVYGTGPISGNNAAECTNPIPFLHVHGFDDGTFRYADGLANPLKLFVDANNCTPQTPPEPGQNEHVCTSFEGCTQPVRFCGFGAGQNNPHNASLRGHYPSPKDPGQATSWVPTEAWNFIKQF